MFDISRELGSSVALYSRKILIQTKAADILPKWLRFLRGACGEREEWAVEGRGGVRRGAEPAPRICLAAQGSLCVPGVVDSEDIPLNLSRELLQESALIR